MLYCMSIISIIVFCARPFCRRRGGNGADMNKKISRLLEPNLILYFLLLIVFAVASLFFVPWLGIAEVVVAAFAYLWVRRDNLRRKRSVMQYIENVAGSVDSASHSTLVDSPLPSMVFRPETQEILWSNESFRGVVDSKEQIFDKRVGDVLPNFSTRWLLEGRQECPERVVVGQRRYRVYGSMVRAQAKNTAGYLATTYWVDTTDADMKSLRYAASRPVVALLTIDNYDEVMKACPDSSRSAVLAAVDEKLNAWVAPVGGLFLKYDRDRYILVFESCYASRLIEEKFTVLEAVRSITVGDGVAVTLSIGIGKDVEGYESLFKYASLALEMALSRGGDQAVVKNALTFEFYGGKSKSTEKRTKVKSRVMANALGELMNDAKEIYVMGHSYADMDAIGAAAGVCCIARRKGKKAQIVVEPEKNSAMDVINLLKEQKEYEGVFVSPEEAFLKAQPGALLVVVDCNRPETVESRQLLEACNQVAVIDHHRRAATYIEDPALNFHEPYASSASELVSELLQYLVETGDILRAEAEALLSGIMLDTKKFTMRTGSRTFEAAAFLRRVGADPVDVIRLFQNDLEEMVTRYSIIRHAEMYRNTIAIAAVEEAVDRVVASQAADELLSLRGVNASFVLYPSGSGVAMSGRSNGDVNVQIVLERLGGGGNSNVAGGRVENATIGAVRATLEASLDAYFEK